MLSRTSVLVREIPLFPLPEVVLFPQSELPLHIYENRYRQMVNNSMQDDGQFGVLMLDKKTKKTSTVGCVTKIKASSSLADGRINILTQGLIRFKLLKITEYKPYLKGLITWLVDEPSLIRLDNLYEDAHYLVKNIVRLTNKLAKNLGQNNGRLHVDLPVNLPLEPEPFSFWVAHNLFRDPMEKQVLLEMTDTKSRLEQEIISLTTLNKELGVRAAIDDVFNY
jgi:ATP-dependent Lon protease